MLLQVRTSMFALAANGSGLKEVDLCIARRALGRVEDHLVFGKKSQDLLLSLGLCRRSEESP